MSSNLSSSELVQAVRVFQIHKAFKKTFVDSPPQTKVLVSFLIPLIAGFLVYSFIHTPVIQLVIFSIIA